MEALVVMQSCLSSQHRDGVAQEVQTEVYWRMLGNRTPAAIHYLRDKAIATCRWFPTVRECLDILEGYAERNSLADKRDTVIARIGNERQARFDELMARLARGECGQTEIDGLSERTKRIAEERGYLRRHHDGGYKVRVPGDVRPQLEASRPAAPTCGKCQDIGRILTLEGEEVDCSSCTLATEERGA